MLNQQQRTQLDKQGFCVVPEILTGEDLAHARQAFDHAVARLRSEGQSTHDDRLDPNASNIRLYNLPEADPYFIEMLFNKIALDCVEAVIGPHFIISNFTANNALPGSGPMNVHSDQALSVPAPWVTPWAVNVIWCLDDIDEENGSTRYLPDSHRIRTEDELPLDIENRMQTFEACAGALVVMDGRLWHSSGSNTSINRQRRLCFAYYCCDFVRPQANWEACLSQQTKAGLNADAHQLFGLGPAANTRLGGALTRLTPGLK